jgi:hypothetical protein
LGTFAMTSPGEYREFALECGKQALDTTDERLRRILLGAARLWMDAALELERGSQALFGDDYEPVTAKKQAPPPEESHDRLVT